MRPTAARCHDDVTSHSKLAARTRQTAISTTGRTRTRHRRSDTRSQALKSDTVIGGGRTESTSQAEYAGSIPVIGSIGSIMTSRGALRTRSNADPDVTQNVTSPRQLGSVTRHPVAQHASYAPRAGQQTKLAVDDLDVTHARSLGPCAGVSTSPFTCRLHGAPREQPSAQKFRLLRIAARSWSAFLRWATGKSASPILVSQSVNVTVRGSAG